MWGNPQWDLNPGRLNLALLKLSCALPAVLSVPKGNLGLLGDLCPGLVALEGLGVGEWGWSGS